MLACTCCSRATICFVDQGVAVIVGEFSAILRSQDSAGTYRTAWDKYVARSAWTHGLVPIYWDNGYTSTGNSGLFNRGTGAQAFPAVISSIVNAAK